MKWDTVTPCKSCPYRKDSKPGTWHKSEFDNLMANDSDPVNGRMFGCHATRKREQPSVCAGWLLDQKKRGLPSIQLRLTLIQNPEAIAALKNVRRGRLKLYNSIAEMVEAQGYE